MKEKEVMVGKKSLIFMIIIMVTIVVALNFIFMEIIKRSYYADTYNYYDYLIEDETRHLDWITKKMQQAITERKPLLIELDMHIMRNVFNVSLQAREQNGSSLASTAQTVSRFNPNTIGYHFADGKIVEYVDGIAYSWTLDDYEKNHFISYIESFAIHFWFEEENEVYAFVMQHDALRDRVRNHMINSYGIIEGNINLWVNDLSTRSESLSVFVGNAEDITIKDESGLILIEKKFSEIPRDGFFFSTYDGENLDIPKKIVAFRKNEEYNIAMIAISDLAIGEEAEMQRNREEIRSRYNFISIVSFVLLGFMIWIMYRIQLFYLNKMNLFSKEMLKRSDTEEQNYKNLTEAVNRDVLTGLYSRKYTNRYLSNLPPDDQARTSYILCDIDHFKNINDGYGHEAGDFVLRDVAKVMSSQNINRKYFVTRWGGEEFLIVFQDTENKEAYYFCEIIRKAIEEYEFNYADKKIKVTMSFGISGATRTGYDFKDAIICADKALYQSKNGGRNRTTIYQEDEEPVIF